jgi:uncharacterized protein YkwD
MRALALATATATAVIALAAPAGARQDETETDSLLPDPALCARATNAEAHHREQRLAMHCLIRELRRNAGLPNVFSSDFLRHSATFKARRIAACKVFTHFPCGDQLKEPFEEAQLARRGRWLVGENLAYGIADDASPYAILRKWVASETHRAVLTDDRFRYVGLRRRRLRMRGAPEGSVIWVAHLGIPRRGR